MFISSHILNKKNFPAQLELCDWLGHIGHLGHRIDPPVYYCAITIGLTNQSRELNIVDIEYPGQIIELPGLIH